MQEMGPAFQKPNCTTVLTINPLRIELKAKSFDDQILLSMVLFA